MVALSESHPWAHSVLARVYLWKRQHAQALAEAEQVVARFPDDADSHAMQSYILSYAGQPEQAITAVEQALRLNPHPPDWYFFALGQVYRLAGRVEEAIAAQQKALTLDPDEEQIYVELAVLYSESGRQEEAQAAVSEFRKRRPNVSLERLKQVLVYKDPAETERILTALRKAGLQ
jgi:tetratricopeptide (TPR) repeat protein